MNKKPSMGLLVVLALISCKAFASEPIDTPDYKIYISSPLEQWSGNESELISSGKSHAAKETSYRVMFRPNRSFMGHPTFFQGPTAHPIIQGANVRLAELGFSIPGESANYFQIELPVSVDKSEAKSLFTNQAQLRKRTVQAQGDPEALQTKTAVKKFAGSIAALGMTVVAMDKLGASMGANLTLGTGLADDAYRLVARYKTGIAPIAFDIEYPETVEAIELRRVTSRDQERTGQIVILYKVTKNEQVEAAALKDAIVVLSGTRYSPEQVQSARAKDFAERKDIWHECIESGDCKK